ncbi:SseB family protein [Lysobacter soli]|uniref:SseB family protein n=1 Tax=Lysobacter soli TaxID=453783 RepID=UPI0037C9D4E8
MARRHTPRRATQRRRRIDLEAWLERVREHPAEEPAFFRALLDATVHVHAPASDDSGKVRLVQFRHPEGFAAIPFFTSMEKAQIAASPAVRILTLSGRDLLAGTRGATLMLNPNDGGAVLYPEEIAALLQSGFMPRIETLARGALQVRIAHAVPAWLSAAVRRSVARAGFIEAAYVLESYSTDACDTPAGLVIYLIAAPTFAERAARLVTAAVQPLCSDADPVIDVMIHDAAQPLPAALARGEILPIYRRVAGTQ